MCRPLSVAILAAVSTLTTVAQVSPAPAEAIQDRYCLQGRKWGYPGNCQFSSYPQYLFARQGRGPSRGQY